MVEWELFVEQNRKNVDELFEFLSGRMHVATDMVAEGATVATTAALFGVLAGGMGGGRRGGFGGAPLLEGAMLGSMMNRGAGGGNRKAVQMNENYNFPIIALNALTTYQPRDYQFALEGRTLFDISQFPKGIKTLNGDISEDAARYQRRPLLISYNRRKRMRNTT